ncbi:GntR family transcriptional regulator [Flexivirga alba]|uniref:GntR family transcriptional regulator n=1 Tax=Flexivirga alba TaxID=702742 RepID=A0ABW2ADP5_9MICO
MSSVENAGRAASRDAGEITNSESNGSGDSRLATTSARVYEELRTAILAGVFPPDSRLTEADLTSRFAVSRGTLRSVLARLVQEGYLVSEANRGARTRSFSVEEAIEILDTRELLESALAARAAERATDEDIADLTNLVELMAEANRTGGREEYAGLIRRFHERIRQAARQATLTRYVGQLMYPLVLRQYRPIDSSHPRPESLAEQQAILSAIITHNASAAEAAMRHHVSAAGRALQIGVGDVDDRPQH